MSHVQNYDDNITNPKGIDFKPDGSTYILVFADKYAIQYDLNPAWDISTSDWAATILLDNFSGDYRDIKFGKNGEKMYAVDNSSRKIEEYNLPTAWDLYNFSYTNNFIYCGMLFYPTAVSISKDGREVIVCGIRSDKRAWKRFYLYTAWDFSHYLEADYYEDIDSELPYAMDINKEGSTMFVATKFIAPNNLIDQKMMPKSWDIDTLITICKYYSEGHIRGVSGLYINEDYRKMYFVNSTDEYIEEYDLR